MDNIVFRRRISLHLRRQIRLHRRETDGVWLNNARELDHGLRLTPEQEIIAEALLRELSNLPKKPRQANPAKPKDPPKPPDPKFFKRVRLETWNILCANLLYASQSYRLIVPMSSTEWKKDGDRYRCIGASVIDDVHMLADSGFIGFVKGSEEEERRTRIFPKRSFMMRLMTNTTTRWVDYFPPEFIVLKKTLPPEYKEYVDPDTGKTRKRKTERKALVNYKDTRETVRIRNILRAHYFVNKAYRIQLHDPEYGVMNLVTALHASYINNWKQGGRFYTSTECGYQQIESWLRPFIRINGEKTVEKDFSGLSLHMLYAMEGIQLEGDPYTKVLEGLPTLSGDDLKTLRDFLKKLLQAALNAESEEEAVDSGNYVLFEQIQDGDKKVKGILDNQLKTSVKDLVRRFKEVHEPLRKYFDPEKSPENLGLSLQNKDSQIALRVINHFTKKRLPVLAIHDSFLVQERYLDELVEVMQDSYKAVMGEKFHCPIK